MCGLRLAVRFGVPIALKTSVAAPVRVSLGVALPYDRAEAETPSPPYAATRDPHAFRRLNPANSRHHRRTVATERYSCIAVAA